MKSTGKQVNISNSIHLKVLGNNADYKRRLLVWAFVIITLLISTIQKYIPLLHIVN